MRVVAVDLPDGADLDLDADRRGRHLDDQRPDVVPDVEQDGALPRKGILGVAVPVPVPVPGAHQFDERDVPGMVWYPPLGAARNGKPSG